MSIPVGTTPTKRGFLLDRIRRVIKEVKPGAIFPTTLNVVPSQANHRQIVTNLGGRVFGQFMGGDWYGTETMPCADVCEVPGSYDKSTPVSPLAYDNELHLMIVVYCADPGGGEEVTMTDGTYQVKAELDQAVADIKVAMQAVPDWYSTDPLHPEDARPACERIGWIGIELDPGVGTEITIKPLWATAELKYKVCFTDSEVFS